MQKVKHILTSEGSPNAKKKAEKIQPLKL